MRLLLLSTYELGHQPLGIAVPAAALEARGHETRGVDLAVSELDGKIVEWADALVVSVPMHTATRLALGVVAAIREERPALPVAWHGLYAPVVARSKLVRPADLLVAGEVVPALLGWLEDLGKGTPAVTSGVQVELGPPRPARPGLRPLRRGLPPLDRYAHLELEGERIVAAGVAATSGCNHRCRHCPVAAVYGGRSRLVETGAVLDDIAQVVAAGAGHVSFADPDFLNRPRHALEVARRLHHEFPFVTFDATVKVEHILRHRALWPELRGAGMLFVVSAFESVDDDVLRLLDKGHCSLDEAAALDVVRASGIELRPSWLPFTPWTTPSSFGALLEFVAEHDLVWSTDAVQYSIRLLLPAGSLLLLEPDPVLAGSLLGVVDGTMAWSSPDRRLDELQGEIAARAEEAGEEPPEVTFAAIWRLAREAGVPLAPEPSGVKGATPWLPGPARPHLSESWFCCAEPTNAQLRAVGVPS